MIHNRCRVSLGQSTRDMGDRLDVAIPGDLAT